jgi:integrase/recombinase XerC
LVLVWSAGVLPGFEALSTRQILHAAADQPLPGLLDEVAVVGSQLLSVLGESTDSYRRIYTDIAHFVQRLELEDVEHLADVTPAQATQFVRETVAIGGGWGDPSPSTMRGRRNAVRLCLRTARQLHLVPSAFDPTADIVLPGRMTRSKRPLSDDEELLGRLAADGTLAPTRRPAAWALGQASAVAGELLAACVRDLDLTAKRVWLHGTANREPRWGALTPWGVERLAERAAHLGGDPQAPLVRGPRATRRSGQAQSCNAINEAFVLAGLAAERDLAPMSLATWAGRRVFDATGRIEEAAKTLGLRSLDTAAAAIGFGWR